MNLSGVLGPYLLWSNSTKTEVIRSSTRSISIPFTRQPVLSSNASSKILIAFPSSSRFSLTNGEQKLIRELSDILANDAAAELRSEVLLAIAQGKLPRVASVNDNGKLFDGERGACDFLRMILG